MAKRRTPEEQWEHLQEQAERARRRLARARDPRVCALEKLASLVFWNQNTVDCDTTAYQAKIQEAIARLVDEAVKP